MIDQNKINTTEAQNNNPNSGLIGENSIKDVINKIPFLSFVNFKKLRHSNQPLLYLKSLLLHEEGHQNRD